MDHSLIYLTLAVFFGFFMAWGVGANDVANAMGTSVGSRALTIKQAIIIAIIFESAGAFLAGGQVTDTIGKELLNSNGMAQQPELLIYGMLAALLAAGTWLAIASHYGWPVSTTHSIIGAIWGFGSICIGMDAINWQVFTNILLSWILTPVLAGIIAYILFYSVQKTIFDTATPFINAKKVVPFYIFLVSFVIILVTLLQGITVLGLDIPFKYDIILSIVLSALATFIGWFILRNYKIDPNAPYKQRYQMVEKIFAVLMIFTACAMAFAHGSNDVANAIGPLAAVVTIVKTGSINSDSLHIPIWVMAVGAIGIVTGLTMYGHRVMATIGTNITQLTPSRGFAAQLATASTVILASGFGLPISTTQTLVGAILGVGFARGMGALNVSVVRNILMSWIVTVPAGAILAILYFYVIKQLFR